MKEILDSAKKNFITWLVMFAVGFGLGKVITYNNIVADCEILGMFRVGDYGAHCYVSKVPGKDPKK